MYINSLSLNNNLYNTCASPSFTSFKREVKNKNGLLSYRGDTCSFRHDLDFDLLVNYLNSKYKKANKVNVIMHACSSGEEVYSFAAALKSILGDECKKFTPLQARDLDPVHINLAKSAHYSMESYELDNAKINLAGDSLDKYYDLLDRGYMYELRTPNKDLKSMVRFKQADILKDVDFIPKKNTVLFARNLWPYLENMQSALLAYKLSKIFDKSSLLVIGDFDVEFGMGYLLESVGFKKTIIRNVYEKAENFILDLEKTNFDDETKKILKTSDYYGVEKFVKIINFAKLLIK